MATIEISTEFALNEMHHIADFHVAFFPPLCVCVCRIGCSIQHSIQMPVWVTSSARYAIEFNNLDNISVNILRSI